jgi:trimeric autotransporter adhesin
MGCTRLLFRGGILVALAVSLAACGGDEEEAAAAAVSDGNHAPTISGTPATSVGQGSSYSFTPAAADADGDALIFGIDAKPSWATFSTSTGSLSGTPAAADVGMHRGIVVWVSDGKAQTLLPAFDVQVMAPQSNNRPPTISGTPATSVVVGASYAFTPTASDPDGQTLTFSIRNRPAWAAFDAATGRLQGSPPSAGTFADVAISVSDGQVAVPLPSFTILVTPPPVNRPPVISGVPMTSVEAGTAYTFVPTANDPDGDTLTFSIAGQPAWAAFDTRTGRLSGTPPSGTTGTFSNIRISVSDGPNTATLAAFSITVTAPTTNRPPTITGSPPTTATQGALYTFTPTASDPDGNALTFSIANRPTWATFNSTNGTLQGTPGAAHIRTYSNIVISVSDGTASTPLPEFSISVASSNNPPTITGSPPTTATVGAQYSFTPTASDADGGTLTFSVTNQPSWATFSTTTGRLQGTPVAANIGTFANIGISVSDGQDSAPLAAFSIVVSAAPNQPPTISGVPPASVTAGTAYSFTPTASDADGGTLTFSIVNQPSWATFSATTGRLQGTPTAANVGTFANIGIGVSDGQGGSAQLAPFSIVVNAVPNQPPTISGVPPTTVTAGTAYSFQPTASDADGGTLTFSITNRPTWATFSTATGRLQGTPTTANVGTFASIGIGVSDGQGGSAQLATFQIVVSAPPNQPPTISGSPPTTVTAGTAYSFTPTASDPDGGTLAFSITNRPAWATFNTTTGRLQGTPTSANVGTFASIGIGVSDGQGGSAQLATFQIVVSAPPNRPPTISGAPTTAVTVGTAYSFTPTTSDPDGDTLTFSIANLPAWASFDTVTGRLSGTPAAQHVGTTSGIVITVDDGHQATTSLAAFNVTVQAVAVGSATLSWTPPTTNTDGSPLNDLAGYKVYWGTSQGNYPNSTTLANPGLTSYVVTNLASGTYFFVATAYNSAGVESSFSGVASKTIP